MHKITAPIGAKPDAQMQIILRLQKCSELKTPVWPSPSQSYGHKDDCPSPLWNLVQSVSMDLKKRRIDWAPTLDNYRTGIVLLLYILFTINASTNKH